MHPYRCTSCTHRLTSEKAQFDQLDLQTKALQLQVKDLVSRLTFLRLQFENESADSVPEADVVILIQDREDVPLYAHKLILDVPQRNARRANRNDSDRRHYATSDACSYQVLLLC